MPNDLSIAIDGHDFNGVKIALTTNNINLIMDDFFPLERAVLRGDIIIAEYLLKKGANIHVNDRQILLYAVRSSHFNNPLGESVTSTQLAEMVELLLRWNADPNGIKRRHSRNFSSHRFDPDERSALSYAVWGHSWCSVYEKVIKHLLGAGADKDYRPTGALNKNTRQNALEIAIGQSQSSEKIALLNRTLTFPNIRGTALRTQPQQTDKPGTGMEKRTAIASALMAGGSYALIFSMAMLIVDKDNNNYKLIGVFGFIAMTLGAAVAGHEIGHVVKSMGYRLNSLFGHMEANASHVTESILGASIALQGFTETAGQAIARLSKTLDETIVILRDETSNTFVELRGMGKDVAAAIQKGINEGKFTPQVDVKANVFAAVPIACNII